MMSIKSKLEALKAMAREEQQEGAGRLAEYGITGADDGVIQTVMENIPTDPGGSGGGALLAIFESSTCAAQNDARTSAE